MWGDRAGVPNPQFTFRAEGEASSAGRPVRGVSVDIGFETVTYMIEGELRHTDVLARQGGDELRLAGVVERRGRVSRLRRTTRFGQMQCPR